MAKQVSNRIKLAIIFAIVWVTSVLVFIFVPFSSAGSNGSYTTSQGIMLFSLVGVGIASFLALVICLNSIYRKRRESGDHYKARAKNIVWGIVKNSVLLAVGLLGGIYGSNYYHRVISIDPTYIKISSYTDMIRLINKDRLASGLKPLIENKLLDESAKAKACDMRDRNYFEHISPDGKEPWYFMKKVGYDYYDAGENIAMGYDSTQMVATAYMNSQSHKDNILDPRYTEVGIGVCGIYSVEHFGNRK